MSVSREASPKAPSPGSTSSQSSKELLGTCFNALHSFMEGEMSVQIEEWNFVDQCHDVLRARYAKIGEKATAVGATVRGTQEQLDQLPTYFAKVDELERNLKALERRFAS